MIDEEKKEYEELKSLLYTGTISQYGKRKLIAIIEKQQAEIEKKDKIIDLMAGYIVCPEAMCLSTEKEVIEYFTNKVEGEQ